MRQQIKLFLIQSKLYWLLAPLSFFSAQFRYFVRLSNFINQNRILPFNDFPEKAPNHSRRKELYSHLLEAEILKENAIDYLEFGVFQGESIRWWTEHNTNTKSQFIGFDTFTGLPESWSDKSAGAFTTEGNIPDIQDKRCSFVSGLFEETLIPFLRRFSFENQKVIHLDADIYSATKFVLDTLRPYLRKNDILLFDEFWSVLHEFRAFDEFINNNPACEYKVLGAVNNYSQIAIKIVEI